jgi:predicted ArsR family transcriptional regulator
VTTVGFTHCPFRELAEAYPDVVCQLHRGIVEGVIEGVPNAEVMVEAFATLADRDPCRVELITR